MDDSEAWELLDAAHAAWCRGDLDHVLTFLTDDFEYQCNAGTADGSPVFLAGKAAFAAFWQPVIAQITTTTVPETFKMLGDVARAQIQGWVRHERTGHEISGSFRQIITFRDGKISAIEEYHDAARMTAFWAMVAHDEADGASRPDPGFGGDDLSLNRS